MNKNKYKTKWDLSLLYKSDKDPKIESQLKNMEALCVSFEKKYRAKDYVSSAEKLLGALRDYEVFNIKLGEIKSPQYFSFRKDIDSNDKVASAMLTKIENRITKAQNKLTFFELNITKIPSNAQKRLLKDKKLGQYAYFLKKIFDSSKYVLSEKEEQTIDLLSQTSYSMWVDGQEKLLNQQTVEFAGEMIPISTALSIVSDLPKKDRRELHEKINQVLKSISHFAEAEINAVYNYKKVLDEKRGFKEPYSATVLGYQNDEKSVELLVKTVSKYFKVSKSFYRLHAKLLGEKKIFLSDRNTKIGKIEKKFDFDSSVSMIGDIFSKIGPEYRNIFDKILQNSQTDAFPKKGKTGGAYCAGGFGMPTFVLLNHTDDLRSLETIAHEMGHAIHTELSKTQPIFYQGYSTATAEVASTFFEQVVTSEIENYLSPDEQMILLHNRIMGDISTIFRQIACFNFELEMHKRIREEGQISKEEMANTLKKHIKSYMGEVVEFLDDDGYFFVTWSHIRNFFYVYSYAYGQIVSRALFEKWKENPKYIEKIKEFLSLGGSMSPEDIFKKIGIDTSDPAFFEMGLKSIEKDIKRLEKLSAKKK